MNSYKIYVSSPLLFIATLIVGIFGGSILIYTIKQALFSTIDELFTVVFAIGLIFLVFYLARRASRAEIEIQIDNDGLKHNWVKRFPLDNRKDFEIKWMDIDNYNFQPDRQFDKFKIKLKDGAKYKFYHNNDYDDKDDFQKFLQAFTRKVHNLNSQDVNVSNNIKQGKTIYETTFGLVLAIFGLIVIIGFPIMVIFFPPEKISWGPAIAAYGGAIYYVSIVYLYRKRAKLKNKADAGMTGPTYVD